MNNTRRGFFASLLALLPLSRTSKGGDIIGTQLANRKSGNPGTLVFINNTPVPVLMSIETNINGYPQYPKSSTKFNTVQPGGKLTSVESYASDTRLTAQVTINSQSQTYKTVLSHPIAGQTVTYYFNFIRGLYAISGQKIGTPTTS